MCFGVNVRNCTDLNSNLSFVFVFKTRNIEAPGYKTSFPRLGVQRAPPRGTFISQNPVPAEDTEAGVFGYTPEANRAAQSLYYSYFNHGFCFINPALKPYTVLKFDGGSWGGL